MPTTRAARAAARAAERKLIALPADVLAHVLYQLPLAHDIARTGLTCHALCDAAKLAQKARPFSGEVVALAGHADCVSGVAAVPDGRVITLTFGSDLTVWRDGTRERTVRAHGKWGRSVAVLGGARLVSGAEDKTAKVWTLAGDLELSLRLDGYVLCVVALPDGAHFALGLGFPHAVHLYHVDGTLVHVFKGQSSEMGAFWSLAVTLDGLHIIAGSGEGLVSVWSVASKSLVSTCVGQHTGYVYAVAAMPDGQRILCGSYEGLRVHLLDGTLKNTFKLHPWTITALVALPDNQHALSGSNDHAIKLFNVNDGAVLRTLKLYDGEVMSLALLPDGLRFVSGSRDNRACIAYHGLAL
jgi:WD40 repeat protein